MSGPGIYILSLVKCPKSTCTVERRVFLPPGVDIKVIESVERRTTAAVVPDNCENYMFFVRGSSLSVNAAMTMIEEVLGRTLVPQYGNVTPKRSKKSSRRLSCALQETLSKNNKKGNYLHASDAVKLAIASCEMEEVDDKPLDDDVILIEGDSDDEENEVIIIDDDESSDDDVIFVDTPPPPRINKNASNNLNNNSLEKCKNVEQITKAFSNMETPSKSATKPIKMKAAVKPLNFDTLSNKVPSDKSVEENSSNENGNVLDGESDQTKERSDKNQKSKKKRTASKLDDSIDTITVDVDTQAIQRKGKVYIEDEFANNSKRQRIRSMVVQPNINVEKTSGNDKNMSTDADAVFSSSECLTERIKPQIGHGESKSDKIANENKERSRNSDRRKKKSSRTSDNVSSKEKEDDEQDNSKTKTDMKEVSHSKSTISDESKCTKEDKLAELANEKDSTKTGGTRSSEGDDSSKKRSPLVPRVRQSRFSDALRYIVIDGSNVAMKHGQDGIFSCKGIRICVDYFQKRGHTMITVFLPQWRKCRPRDPNSVSHRYVLDDLEKEGYLIYTPSRRIGNKLVASYDDRYIIELAEREDGVVVSNDQYRDLLTEKHSWRRVIETRLLMYSFVRDHFMPPDDPYGKCGPKLDELLRKSCTKPSTNWRDDMYSRLKYLEKTNPRSDLRETERDFYGNRAGRY